MEALGALLPAHVLEVVAEHAALDEVGELDEREHGELAVAVLNAELAVAEALVAELELELAVAGARAVFGEVGEFAVVGAVAACSNASDLACR